MVDIKGFDFFSINVKYSQTIVSTGQAKMAENHSKSWESSGCQTHMVNNTEIEINGVLLFHTKED